MWPPWLGRRFLRLGDSAPSLWILCWWWNQLYPPSWGYPGEMSRSSWPVDGSLILPVVLGEKLTWSMALWWPWCLRCDLFWGLLNRGACKLQLPDWRLEQLVQGPPARLLLGRLPGGLWVFVKLGDLIEQCLKVSSTQLCWWQ